MQQRYHKGKFWLGFVLWLLHPAPASAQDGLESLYLVLVVLFLSLSSAFTNVHEHMCVHCNLHCVVHVVVLVVVVCVYVFMCWRGCCQIVHIHCAWCLW